MNLREPRIRDPYYRAIFELSSVGVVQCDPLTGRFHEVNQCFCEMIGYARSELAGLRVADLRPSSDQSQERNAALFDGHQDECEVEMRCVRKDGQLILLKIAARLIRDSRGEPIETVAIVQDITERRAMEDRLGDSEERFRAFMDNSPAVAWAKDEQGRHVYLSKSYERRMNVDVNDRLGKTDFEIWPHDIAENFQKNDATVLRTGQILEVIEESTDGDAGRSLWWCFKFPFRDASGKRYVGGIGVDITALKKTEAALEAANASLETRINERTKELQRLASHIAVVEEEERRSIARDLHDNLGQVLYVLRYKLDALMRSTDDQEILEQAQKLVSLAGNASERVRSLTSQLSSPVLNTLGLVPALYLLAEQMEKDLELTVEIEVNGTSPLLSSANAATLYRGVRELLINVSKHSQVCYALVQLATDDAMLVVKVKDEGIGMKYSPVKLSYTSGYGLLSLSERLRFLGGSLSIESDPQQGTTVTLRLPLENEARLTNHQ